MAFLKTLYLIRHGHVAFPDNVRLCIGRTDLPLSDRGRQQAQDLYGYFKDKDILVYASPLQRAKVTAQVIAGDRSPLRLVDDLMEMDMGEWENRPLKNIKKTLTSEPEKGEKRRDALKRMAGALDEIIRENRNNSKHIVCVAHASVNTCWIADVLGVPLEISRSFPQPYGCMNILGFDGKAWHCQGVGIMPNVAPDLEECRRILDHYGTPDRVQRHCERVAEEAVELGEKINRWLDVRTDSESVKALPENSRKINIDLLRAAALLHDIARTQNNHPYEGAQLIRREGYPAVARIVRQHHDLENPLLIDEAALLYYSDKMVAEDRVLSVDERFLNTWDKFFESEPSKEAVDAFYRRYRHARIIQKRLQGMGVIP